MRNYLLNLFAHEEWANAKVIGALRSLLFVPNRTEALLHHLFAAHDLWDKRLRGEEFKQFDAWPELTLEECAELNRSNAEKWRTFIGALPHPIDAQTVTFVGLDQKKHTLRIMDVLTQLHAHSIHHRAQMMPDMRAAGLEPVATDYILFCLEQEPRV